MLIGGNNVGRIGQITSIDKHPGSFTIVNVKDARGNTFSTRLCNILVVGDNKTQVISLPRGEGIRQTLIQERDARRGEESSDEAEDEDDN